MRAAGGAQIIPHAPASDQGGLALARVRLTLKPRAPLGFYDFDRTVIAEGNPPESIGLRQLTVCLNLSFPNNGTVKGAPADPGQHLFYYRHPSPLE